VSYEDDAIGRIPGWTFPGIGSSTAVVFLQELPTNAGDFLQTRSGPSRVVEHLSSLPCSPGDEAVGSLNVYTYDEPILSLYQAFKQNS
jgi:hypothetical protein